MLLKTFTILNILYYSENGSTHTEICEKSFESKQTVSLIINKLTKEGSAETRQGLSDARERVVYMTDAGRARYGDCIREMAEAEERAMLSMPPEEQRAIGDLMEKYTDNLMKELDREKEKTALRRPPDEDPQREMVNQMIGRGSVRGSP